MIRELPIKIINLLKAGEVVERPSSVVKELVENAIDAKSSKIIVNLQAGGIEKIEVIDDGIGMDEQDALIATKQHTTSKIHDEQDLFNINTLGFRGEALPSIKAVSKLTIHTAKNDGEGIMLSYKGEELLENKKFPRVKGTTITVDNIFFNHPVRKKALKSESSELSAITLLLERIAIAHPDIKFTLANNERAIFHTNGNNDVLSILADIYGSSILRHTKVFNFKTELYSVDAIISDNNLFRSNKNAIHLTANGRIIQNKNLIYAVQRAYESIIPIGKSPIVVLRINGNADLLDVNIHPSKLEIKFTDEDSLVKAITYNLRNKLYESDLAYDAKQESFKEVVNEPVKPEQPKYEYSVNLNFDNDSVDDFSPVQSNESIKSTYSSINSLWDSFEKETDSIDEVDELKEETPTTLFDDQDDQFKFSNLHYIGQYHKTYLLFTDEDNLYLIDQHAAMERIRYEQIYNYLEQPDNNYIVPLVPLEVEVSKDDAIKLVEKLDELKQLNIELVQVSNTKFNLIKQPNWFMHHHEVEFLQEIINSFINDSYLTKHLLYENLSRTIACKSSIKGNTLILKDEVYALLNGLDNCKMPYTCPHGRPTLVKVTAYEVEKMFKRVI